MGKGDIKTKKGKVTNGSYGVTRKRKDSATIVVKPKPKKEVVAKAPVVEKPARPSGGKAPAKKAPVVKKETTKKAPAKK